MLADAARTYLQQYGVAVGRRVVVVTAHDSGYRAAQELKAAGVEVVAIADIRSRPAPTGEAESAERSEEHTSELQSLMRISYAVFCLKKKKTANQNITKVQNNNKQHITIHQYKQQNTN